MTDTPTPAPALTDERVRMLYATAYAWRTEDSAEDGERDLSEMRVRQGAEFDRWLAAHDAAVIDRAKREVAEYIARTLAADAQAADAADKPLVYVDGVTHGEIVALRVARGVGDEPPQRSLVSADRQFPPPPRPWVEFRTTGNGPWQIVHFRTAAAAERWAHDGLGDWLADVGHVHDPAVCDDEH